MSSHLSPAGSYQSASYYHVAAKFEGGTHNRAQGGGRIGRRLREDDDSLIKEQYMNYSEARRASALFVLFKKHLKKDDLDEIVGILLEKAQE
ncbi:hypothetical protein NMY22_g12083 [Coprinellus aureogranulatus]|nr:hypothetical protein NMY22_g12083 [Coprinellus aureogranulatus]